MAYKPWRYADRRAVAALQQRRFAQEAQRASPDFRTSAVEEADAEIEQLRGEDGGGGGFFGRVKDIGSRALDVLDVATETTSDIVKAGPQGRAAALIGDTAQNVVASRGNPIDFARRQGRDIVREGGYIPGVSEIAKLAQGRDPLGGTARNTIASRGNVAEFGERQLEDFRDKPGLQRLAEGVVYDPTNVIGLGAASKGLQAVRGAGRGARFARGLGRVNEAADVAQARFGREIVGGTVGAVAGGLIDGEEGAVKGAIGGAVLGRGSRFLGKRGAQAARQLADSPLLSSGIVDEGAEASPEAAVGAKRVAAGLGDAGFTPGQRVKGPKTRETAAAGAEGTVVAAARGRVVVEYQARSGKTFRLTHRPGSLTAGGAEESTDLLKTRGRLAAISEAHEGVNLGDRLGQRRGRFNPETAAVRNELQRIERLTPEFVREQVDQIRFDSVEAGLDIQPDEGQWVLQGATGGKASLSDAVEGRGDAAREILAALTPEQRAIIDRAQQLEQGVTATMRYHGLEPALVTTDTGDFWPRRVIAAESGGEVRGRTGSSVGGQGRRLGGKSTGQRTMASEAESVAAGNLYADPWTALTHSLETRLNMARDAYLADLIKPLAAPDGAKAGLGFRALRVNHPALSQLGFGGLTEEGATILRSKPLLFEDSVAKELDDILGEARLLTSGVGQFVRRVQSYATPLRAAFDVSFMLNQGLAFLLSSPRNFAKALRAGPRVVLSAIGDPQKYATLQRQEATRTLHLLSEAGIKESDRAGWLTRLGKHYSPEDLPLDEWQFPLAAEDLPIAGKGVKWSNQTFGRYLNYGRDVLSNDLLERGLKQGMRGKKLETFMEEGLRSVNRMTGWTATKPTDIERLTAFAPTFTRATFEQLGTALTKGGIEGAVARRHMLTLMGFGATAVFISNSLRGYETSVDPRDANFLRFRNVGGIDISPFGPYATLVRGIAQTVAGDPGDAGSGRGRGLSWGSNAPRPSLVDAPLQFARSKSAPVAGVLWSLFTGANYQGEPFSLSSPAGALDASWKVGQESLPFTAQALLEEGPVAGALSGLGAQGAPTTPAERRDFRREELALAEFGRGYDELPGTDKSLINEDPTIQRLIAEAEQNRLTRRDKGSLGTEADQEFRETMRVAGEWLRAGRDDEGQPFSGADFREGYHEANLARRAVVEAAGEGGGDPEIETWFALYDMVRDPTGRLNYDLLDQLQGRFATEHPDIAEKIDRLTGARDDEVMRQFRRAQQEAAAYYDIPAFLGMSVAESSTGSRFLNIASAMVSAGQAPNRQGALNMLALAGWTAEAELALRASRADANPERAEFRRSHPDFALFYTGLVSGVGEPLGTYSPGQTRGRYQRRSRSRQRARR